MSDEEYVQTSFEDAEARLKGVPAGPFGSPGLLSRRHRRCQRNIQGSFRAQTKDNVLSLSPFLRSSLIPDQAPPVSR